MRGLMLLLGGFIAMTAHAAPPLLPAVEVEEPLYTYQPADNGAGPLWCYGSTCLARLGDEVFASGIETIPNQKPLNNVRWMLYQRKPKGWQLMQSDPTGRQREPCPLGILSDGRLLLTSNPTLTPPDAYNGSAQPQVLVFDTKDLSKKATVSLPQWDGTPPFSEHSYRGFCADGVNNEALYFNNIGYDTIHWSFLDREGKWAKFGKLSVPFGAEFEKPEPIRICYHNMALKNRAAHTMGVSDIIEPVREWREYKLILNKGKTWDYDFRRLYYCYTPDITKEAWKPWILVADCDKTCGHITNLDMWLDDQGRAHLLWLEQSVWNPLMRDKFFPEVPITYALMYGIVDQGKVVCKSRLAFGGEKQESKEIPGYARFQATPDGRLFVFYFTSGSDASGRTFSENRLMEVYRDGSHGEPVRVALEHPFTAFMTATERGGSAPSATLDIYGQAPAVPGISYARISLLNPVLAEFEATVTRTATGSKVALDGSPSRCAEGKIASWAWQIGKEKATGAKAEKTVQGGGRLPVTLTVRDTKGHTHTASRTLQLPPAPADFGLKQWGQVLRIEAEAFAAEGGGTIHRRADKLAASGMSLSHWDPLDLWLEWQFEVPTADKYYLLARYAVPADAARVLTVDDKPVGTFAFPSTGGYGSEMADNWGVIAFIDAHGKPVPLSLSQGSHRLRLHNKDGRGLNLDYLELIAATKPLAPAVGYAIGDDKGYRYLTAQSGTIPPTQANPELGFCYTYQLGPLFPGDGIKDSPASTLRLFEDGKDIGPAHAPHVDIREKGQGRYSHWSTALYFSASDNSDPRTNGRRYTWRLGGAN
ncbi:MAG: PKD domain-containing protein [Armatimonadia bacterium]